LTYHMIQNACRFIGKTEESDDDFG
jgi:hypothetical protein